MTETKQDDLMTKAQRQLDEFLVDYREKCLVEHAANKQVLEACVAAGVLQPNDVCVTAVRMGTRVPLTVEQLPALRKHLPQLRDTGAYEPLDSEAGTVRVYLDCGVKHCGVRLFYVKTLPDGGPCKFVEEHVPAGTVKRLVCSKPE